MHDREFAFAPRALERLQFRVQPEAIVQPHRVPLRDPEPRPRPVVMLVFERRHEGEPIGRTAQENHDQRAPLVAVTCDECLRRHDLNGRWSGLTPSRFVAEPLSAPTEREAVPLHVATSDVRSCRSTSARSFLVSWPPASSSFSRLRPHQHR